MKYIEAQLKKRKGIEVENKDGDANKYLTPEEAAVSFKLDSVQNSFSNFFSP